MKKRWLLIADAALAAVLALGAAACEDGGTNETVETEAAATEAPAAEIPVVDITVTKSAFAAPDSIPGGLTRIRLHNASTGNHQAQLMRLKDGATLEQFLAALQIDVQDEIAFATSAHEIGTLTAAAGGTQNIGPGGTSEVIHDLEPGRYVLVSYNPGAPPPRPLEVTGAPPAQPSKPEAQATVRMSEFAFEAPDTLPAGTTTVEVVNDGRQIHWMEVQRVNEGVTADQVTPVPNYMAAGGMAELDPGGSGWAILDLSPGVYVLLCGVADVAGGSGKQHFQLGMYNVFTVQ